MFTISVLLTFSSSVGVAPDVQKLVKMCTAQMRERMVEGGIYFRL